MSVARQELLDEHELYPCHEEDSLPEIPEHEEQSRYLRDALGARLPGCWVGGDICMYWIRGNTERYIAPDVLVLQGAEQPHRIYLAWADNVALLTIEVGSESTFRRDEGPKVERYLLDLGVKEYLYCHAARQRLRMWRLVDGAVVEVTPTAEGRFVSETLNLEFGLDGEQVMRVYERGGELLPGYGELQVQALLDRQRAENETRRAESEARRAENEARRAETEAQRAGREADRANEERRQRLALEQELERLREELRRRDDPPA